MRHREIGPKTTSTSPALQAKMAETPAQYHRKMSGSAANDAVATPRDSTDNIPGTKNVEMASAKGEIEI